MPKSRRSRSRSKSPREEEQDKQNTALSSNDAQRIPSNSANSNNEKKKKKKKTEEKEEVLKVIIPGLGEREYPGIPSNVFDTCGEDDPAICFNWNDAAVGVVLAHFLAAVVNRPAWFPKPHNTTTELKEDIVAYVRNITAGNMKSHGTLAICPLTLAQSSQVKDKIRDLCFDPLVVAAYNANPGTAPLATVYHVADGARPAKFVGGNVAPVPAHAVQAFF